MSRQGKDSSAVPTARTAPRTASPAPAPPPAPGARPPSPPPASAHARGAARLLPRPGELRVSAAPAGAGRAQSPRMDAEEPREPREPGPGAETAAAPRWEEAKTFYDNVAPKKKPKSVRTGHGFGVCVLGRGVRVIPEEGSPAHPHTLRVGSCGSQLLGSGMRSAFVAGLGLFWEPCSPPPLRPQAWVLC